jgi:predicted DNA-binding transcriptional regulator YafY
VQGIEPYKPQRSRVEFDVRELLNRAWLGEAMQTWAREATVKIRLTVEQARRLQKDWYYGHALFEPIDNHVLVTLGENNQGVVFELLRWLGPGAELLEPVAWRETFRAEVAKMLETYS